MGRHRPLILIADDDKIRMELKDIIREDYRLVEASNGVEAIAALKQFGPEFAAAIIGIDLPKLDGFGVLAKMQKFGWDDAVPVLLAGPECARGWLAQGFEMGARDAVFRPFEPELVRQRLKNMMLLKADQKTLRKALTTQLRQRDRTQRLMIDILSAVVEFRNGESGLHVQRIRALTAILLGTLAKRYPQYRLRREDITEIANAAALHDIGKLCIPEEILNKPGKLTGKEYQIMMTHAARGAEMLEKFRFEMEVPLVRYAYDICRWHHERWDGSGYPDGRAGADIPIWAQAVCLADVYDALVSPRVYKPAYPHDKAIVMLLNGECGAFNPDLIDCLLSEAPRLERRIRQLIEKENKLLDMEKISCELETNYSAPFPDRSLFFLEQERKKLQFLFTNSDEVFFDYDINADTLFLSDQGSRTLGCATFLRNAKECIRVSKWMTKHEFANLEETIKRTTPENKTVSTKCRLNLPLIGPEWYELKIMTFWDQADYPARSGFVGKLTRIRLEKDVETNLDALDALTGVFVKEPALTLAKSILASNVEQKAAAVVLDLDNFRQINGTYGHFFGDRLLEYVAGVLKDFTRKGDIASRIGGDRFFVFYQSVQGEEEVARRAGRLLNALCGCYQDCRFSVSMGISMYPADGRQVEVLFDRAEQALYIAKHSGKKQLAFYQSISGTNWISPPPR